MTETVTVRDVSPYVGVAVVTSHESSEGGARIEEKLPLRQLYVAILRRKDSDQQLIR